VNKKLKIGYFADGVWGQLALNKILKSDKFDIKFITPRYDSMDPIICKIAKQNNIPLEISNNVNSQEFLSTINSYSPDLLISMSFNQILKKEILNIAPKRFINCHAGALPFYRGRNPLNWVLINGEKQYGITVHYVDEGIDTGDIIIQNLYNISDEDSYKTLLDKACKECADILLNAMDLIYYGHEKRIKQSSIHPVGFYCNQRLCGDEKLNWNDTSINIHNFIRGITLPGPGARTFISNAEYAIIDSNLIDNAPEYIGIPGAVVGKIQDKGIVVKTLNTTILITKMAEVKNQQITDSFIPTFKIGTRFC
jgi:methionyl-tRNA formyltransferase